jgi:carbon-monoxide dehydrogenase small subunit
VHYDLKINGETSLVSAAANATLLEVLRDTLAFTGTKRGCNLGVCGACTVLLDGAAVRACLTLAANVGEREVLTIEGIGCDGALSRLQQAFAELGAVQCGFCTPGMIMGLMAFLRDHPRPTRAELRAALSGHLCRCTGYAKILDAALAASDVPA